MKARVLIGHFEKDRYQGSTTSVGVYVMDVKVTDEQILIYRGCQSPEIGHDKLKTVTIHNRVFVVREPAFNRDTCDYEVYLPYELATNLRKVRCNCCGNATIDSN